MKNLLALMLAAPLHAFAHSGHGIAGGHLHSADYALIAVLVLVAALALKR